MAKFYAVKKGKKTGIFSTWDECKEQVTGFKGAVYKSFKTLSEAEAFLERNEEKIKEITLFYDYQGIEAWAVGDWKAILPYTQDYVKFYSKVKMAVKVNFVKVKAHTGIELNEVVDKLAKEAIEQFKKENTK